MTNPKEELLGDVLELALGMLTLAMRHPGHERVNPSFAKVLLQVLCLRVLLRKTAEVESYINEMTASFRTTRFEVTPTPRRVRRVMIFWSIPLKVWEQLL